MDGFPVQHLQPYTCMNLKICTTCSFAANKLGQMTSPRSVSYTLDQSPTTHAMLKWFHLDPLLSMTIANHAPKTSDNNECQMFDPPSKHYDQRQYCDEMILSQLELSSYSLPILNATSA